LKFFDKARLLFSNSSWDDYIRAFISGNDIPMNPNNINITSETAMKYTAVFACVRVLSETLAGMPILLYKKTEGGDRKPSTDLLVYDVLHSAPNEEMSPFSFKEACMISLNTGGNAVAEKMVNALGEVIGLYPYPWSAVEIKRNDSGKLVYEISGTNGTKRTLQRKDVFHIPGLSFDGVIGVSPISYAAGAIRLGLSYEMYGINFYKNGAAPSGIFSFPGTLTDEAFQRLKADLNKNYAGLVNVGKPMLLEGDGKFLPVSIAPVDAQLLESKKFQTEDVARIYRVPLHLIQNLDRATFSNIEQQSLEFVMYTMLPWFKRWEENINMQLLTREQRKAGYYFEFKIDSLLRGDAKSRAEAYAAGRQWGWLSVNDIRRLENMSPIGAAGDIYLTPANMYEAGKEPEPGTTTNAKLVQDIYRMIKEGGNGD